MKKANAPQLKVGDLVRIKKYSSLFGSNDPVADKAVSKVIFKVAEVEENICGDDENGWYDDIYLENAEDGSKFPYMITNDDLVKA